MKLSTLLFLGAASSASAFSSLQMNANYNANFNYNNGRSPLANHYKNVNSIRMAPPPGEPDPEVRGG